MERTGDLVRLCHLGAPAHLSQFTYRFSLCMTQKVVSVCIYHCLEDYNTTRVRYLMCPRARGGATYRVRGELTHCLPSECVSDGDKNGYICSTLLFCL